MNKNRVPKEVIFLCALIISSGCATTPDRGNNDPIEPVNRVFFNVNETLDKYLMKPIAKGYVKITPQPVRNSVTNFFANLFYPNVIVNDFLQGKFKHGVEDLARLFINSTIGVGGLFDPAASAGLPEHNEDLGQTLAKWGVGEGAYLVLPLRGPSSLRHAPDIASRALLSPFFYIESAANIPVGALSVVNERANLLEATEIRDQAALDSYSFTREAYRQVRRSLIYDGDPPTDEFDDFFEDEE